MTDAALPNLAAQAGWLPLAFLFIMGLAILAYVVLDGYDLGVGILLRTAPEEDKDTMVNAIGPFWDANETWLVLGVGILLTAFPLAHGAILTALYLPVALMLAGLILRGVAFDFRVKAQADHKPLWNALFSAGSLLATAAQGYMVGALVCGFRSGWLPTLFSLFIALCLVAAYNLLGAGWLLIKTSGALQQRALAWAQGSLRLTLCGVIAVSAVTPLVSPHVLDRWFAGPNFVLLLPIPVLTGLLVGVIHFYLGHLPEQLRRGDERHAWVPFAATVGIFVLAFLGLAYSLFPYLVVDRLTLWQAASDPEALRVIFAGSVVVLPMILAYTAYMYRVFSGKATPLEYY
ncbi:MAG TPA: cytochrome d ubiquinol oxidase subunit II [Rhodocyclaceae bacterium]